MVPFRPYVTGPAGAAGVRGIEQDARVRADRSSRAACFMGNLRGLGTCMGRMRDRGGCGGRARRDRRGGRGEDHGC
ncbi:SEC-C motif-containing protein [Deinococcus grandis]|uniref:SEC-C motif-containing protein n=1 Tax=Deinococcus grandis TaxID=57498 RepID=A0A100HKM0_9DEIO|nr:SEC-C motif-containing protein [Deinococcus grandis]